MQKLYIVTRRDISPGYQLAQCCHAMRQWSEEQPELDREWFHNSNYIVCLSVENLEELLALIEDSLNRDIKTVWFREPDIDDEITAAVFEPGERTSEFLRGLQLALRRATEDVGDSIQKRDARRHRVGS